MTHTHINGHTTTIKTDRVLIQALAQIRKFTRKRVDTLNDILKADFNAVARRDV